MVERALNKPFGHIGSTATYWLKFPGTTWNCRKCYTHQCPGSICIEITQYDARDGEGVRRYLCAGCAKSLFKQGLDMIKEQQKLQKISRS